MKRAQQRTSGCKKRVMELLFDVWMQGDANGRAERLSDDTGATASKQRLVTGPP
jgi:hypothetical protein